VSSQRFQPDQLSAPARIVMALRPMPRHPPPHGSRYRDQGRADGSRYEQVGAEGYFGSAGPAGEEAFNAVSSV